jgi:aminopeptidase N
LWLNEGFARWMQTHAADALHPDWRTGLQAQAIFERGKRADAKPSTHAILQPISSAEQAIQAFDAITYNKGAAVVTMLESYIGADNFREGVRHYMRLHAYGNTSDSDLWSEMQKVSDKPIVEIEKDFTGQPGLPLIHVKEEGEGSGLSVARFYENPGSESPSNRSWHIPIAVTCPNRSDLTMLLSGQTKISAPAPLVNAGAMSYTRVFYSPKLTALLLARFPRMAAADQLNLINDEWALGEAGYTSAGDLLDYLRAVPKEADAIVWSRACELLVTIDRNYSVSAEQEAFRHFALATLEPVSARVGTSAQPKEDPAVTSLRTDLWRAQARFGDAAARARADEVFAAEKASQEERRAALQIVAQSANESTFNKLLTMVRATADPFDRMHILEAMAGVADPALAARFTEIALSPDAPSGTASSLLDAASENNPESVWKTLAPHLDDPNLPIDPPERGVVIPNIAGRSALPGRIDDLRHYAEGHIAADARQAVDAAVASIGLNQRVRERAIPQINAWIAKQAAK